MAPYTHLWDTLNDEETIISSQQVCYITAILICAELV